MLDRISDITKGQPRKVFLLIGINDLARNYEPEQLMSNYRQLLDSLRLCSPRTKVYIQSLLPVNDQFKKFPSHTAKAALIPVVNQQLHNLAKAYRATFIDLYTAFLDKNGKLSAQFTNDGLHLLGRGYQHWKSILYPYVFDLTSTRPALIPQPQQLVWGQQSFFIPTSLSIEFDSSLTSLAAQTQRLFEHSGAVFKEKQPQKIVLKLGKVNTPLYPQEAYRLLVDSSQVVLMANTPHGIFNGIQTLRQLLRDGVYLPACQLLDYPAFAWRGLMYDVGRNFQSLPFLKAQLEVMAQYKLNIFHFHLTEDIAWRLESKRYPQLTYPDHMTRNKGEFYSQAELQELIQFCKDRYITLVPELDMPGHSEAFRRTFGVEMQSVEGVPIVKELLQEFCQTFDVPYVHLGGDEVKITNTNFLPEMTTLIESYGKKVVGWRPGGNLPQSVIQQLWQGEAKPQQGIATVDSRFLYLNHHDPLESVVTIFHDQICTISQGDAEHLGAIVCVWPDRRVATQEAILKQNPVYPALLALAERCWLGGGINKGKTLIGKSESRDFKAFAEFENRLLDHKKLYFRDKSFPYVRQSTIRWHITAPFDNQGKLEMVFEPEQKADVSTIKTPTQEAIGGTLYLRHWWHPLSESWLQNPKENSTVYAFTQVWSEMEQEVGLWAGFNNLSRSTATDSPPSGQWDNRQSNIWLNQQRIAPPVFSRAGQKGHSEIPLVDENYECRTPILVHLKKGWNQLLVKAPVGSFKGPWQNPVKWMFTAVLVEPDELNPEAFEGYEQPPKTTSTKLHLAKVFTDNMVLQREQPLRIWGKATPFAPIVVRSSRPSKSFPTQQTTARADSSWSVSFPPQKANATPQTLHIISQGDTVHLTNLLIGDVWLCAGQSNMAFMLKNDQFASQTLSQTHYPNLRLLNWRPQLSTYNISYKPQEINYLQPENFYSGSWKISDSLAARDFSAIGFYFGATLQTAINVPIGLINLAVGGSPCEAWMSAEAVKLDTSLSRIIQTNWLLNPALEPWCIERGHQNLDKLLTNNYLIPQDSLGYHHPFKPTFLYKAGIESLLNLPIKGVIWYQGESNALSWERTQQHEKLFPLLINDWRQRWKLGNFPFYFCQLSSISTANGYKSEYWPEFRDSQRRIASALPNVGMAITSDYGHWTDVHPTNKKIVGQRLASIALEKTYRQTITSSGPTPLHIKQTATQFIVTFDQALQTTNGLKVNGFELETFGNKRIDSEGIITGKMIILTKHSTTSYKRLLYAWKPFTNANLANLAGLPVSTFQMKLP